MSSRSECGAVAASVKLKLAPLSLSLSSSTKRSAVFLPMPGMLHRREMSCARTACCRSSEDSPDKMPSAVRAPMPLILISMRKLLRSAAVAKPNSCCASSRMARWRNNVTFSPALGRVYNVLMGTSIS